MMLTAADRQSLAERYGPNAQRLQAMRWIIAYCEAIRDDRDLGAALRKLVDDQQAGEREYLQAKASEPRYAKEMIARRQDHARTGAGAWLAVTEPTYNDLTRVYDLLNEGRPRRFDKVVEVEHAPVDGRARIELSGYSGGEVITQVHGAYDAGAENPLEAHGQASLAAMRLLIG